MIKSTHSEASNRTPCDLVFFLLGQWLCWEDKLVFPEAVKWLPHLSSDHLVRPAWEDAEMGYLGRWWSLILDISE